MPTRWVLDRMASAMFRRAGLTQWIDPFLFALALGFLLEPASIRGAKLVGKKIYYDARCDRYEAHAYVLTEVARAELRSRELPTDDASAYALVARIVVGGLRRMTLSSIDGGAAAQASAPALRSALQSPPP